MPERKRKFTNWFPVWCQSLGNMLVYHFHRYAVGAYIILVVVLVLALGKVQSVSHQAHDLAIKNRHLVVENRHRIAEIQESRLHSCEQTYESFHEVFKPFIRPAEIQTPKEKRDLVKFNRIIAKLKAKCVMQTLPRKTKP